MAKPKNTIDAARQRADKRAKAERKALRLPERPDIPPGMVSSPSKNYSKRKR